MPTFPNYNISIFQDKTWYNMSPPCFWETAHPDRQRAIRPFLFCRFDQQNRRWRRLQMSRWIVAGNSSQSHFRRRRSGIKRHLDSSCKSAETFQDSDGNDRNAKLSQSDQRPFFINRGILKLKHLKIFHHLYTKMLDFGLKARSHRAYYAA